MAVRSLILVLAVLALTAMPAFARGGGGGGGGFHRRDRFDRFHRLGFSAATPYWYHCAENDGYYPYTQQCPGGWREVPTTAMG